MKDKILELFLDIIKAECKQFKDKDEVAWNQVSEAILILNALLKRAHEIFQIPHRRGNQDVQLLQQIEKSLHIIKQHLSQTVLLNQSFNKWIDDCLMIINNGRISYENIHNPEKSTFIIIDLLGTINVTDYKSFNEETISNYINVSGYSFLQRAINSFMCLPAAVKIMISLVIIFLCGPIIQSFFICFYTAFLSWQSMYNYVIRLFV